MKITVHLLAASIALGLAGAAGATGTRFPMTNTEPGVTPKQAAGALSDARRAGRRLDCWVLATRGRITMGCNAEAYEGGLFSCTSSDPRLVELATLVRGDSDVRISVERSGECRSIDFSAVTATSESYPKAK